MPALGHLIESPALQETLRYARQISPVKGYPLRTDFLTAPTVGERTLLAGESAGLVNPLTGEGIAYALESGQIAARHIRAMFASSDLSQTTITAYDVLLRQHF